MILVTGAGGFIGGHLAAALVAQGEHVRAVDLKPLSSWWQVHANCESIGERDLRGLENCLNSTRACSQVFHFAADMGGMGFIHDAECDVMRNNSLIDVNMVHAAVQNKVERFFYSSSVCVYRDMKPTDDVLAEDGAYPALADNEYGWEKLYAERLVMAHERRHGIHARIARFQNCYGPLGAWNDGREKAPAALCRKVAQAHDGGLVEVWGDGTAVRSYTYVDDMVDATLRLMASDYEGPVNVGRPEYITVDDLVSVIAEVAGKSIGIKHVDGPIGVQSRNFANDRIESLGWRSQFSVHDGVERTYEWIADQVRSSRAS